MHRLQLARVATMSIAPCSGVVGGWPKQASPPQRCAQPGNFLVMVLIASRPGSLGRQPGLGLQGFPQPLRRARRLVWADGPISCKCSCTWPAR
jgi:hypothetical protein